MKKIYLTKGQAALVDDADYEMLSQYKWQFNGRYASSTNIEKNKVIQMHRFLMNPADDMVVDHIDSDGLDNRRENLRICTKAQNGTNKRTTSKYKGVRKRTNCNRFEAEICHKYKSYYLGLHLTEEAAEAYNKKAIELHGEYDKINEIN